MGETTLASNLNRDERLQIETLYNTGRKPSEIAEYLGRNLSTIYRELGKHCDENGRYCSIEASKQAKINMTRLITRGPSAQTIAIIESKLTNEQWSPQQIEAWLERNHNETASHTWIYGHIANDEARGGELVSHLRHGHYEKEGIVRPYRGNIKNRTPIEKRPDEANQRSRLGDFEVDLVVGPKNRGAIITLIDRRSRWCVLRKLTGKTAEATAAALISMLKPLSIKKFTITSDNGTEFSLHEEIAKALGIKYYFANPYASYERGSIENLNGLIRQYIPKGTNFDTVSDQDVKVIETKLNTRPRRVLGYLTPLQFIKNGSGQ